MKMRGLGELGEDSASLPWPFGLLLPLLRMGAEFDEAQRGGGGAFSLPLPPGIGEFLRGGVGGTLGLGNAFTRVPKGAEMVYERRCRRARLGLGERLHVVSTRAWRNGFLAAHECSAALLKFELPGRELMLWIMDAVEYMAAVSLMYVLRLRACERVCRRARRRKRESS